MSSYCKKNVDQNKTKGAVIVPFPIELTRAPKSYDAKTAQSAQVVFFLGVRYERLVSDDTLQAPVLSKKKSRRQSQSS